ncbi:MAG: hypothetical protein K8R48_10370 [Alphaproteobacteria bacterium]|nr:hypothetical protein [Alphaproteobacteria bacterium]
MMCFSPVASFTASAVLTVIGGVTLRKTKTPQEWLLASLPLLFAAQQFTEGLLWLALLQGKTGAGPYWLTQAYAVFAGTLLPLAIPLGIFLIEPNNIRRRWLAVFFLIGGGVAAYTLSIIVRFGFEAEISNRCILYRHPAEQGPHMLLLYIIATCAAFFCSSERGLLWIGIANIWAFAAAYYFYQVNLVSVWCFFAAILSGMLCLYFEHRKNAKHGPENALQPTNHPA